MNKSISGIIFGTVAGIIDVIPMIIMKLTWDANLSAFSMWVVIGFLLANSSLKINPIVKGLLYSFAVLLPSAIIIGWKEPASLMPIAIMTTLLGSALGFTLNRFLTKKNLI